MVAVGWGPWVPLVLLLLLLSHGLEAKVLLSEEDVQRLFGKTHEVPNYEVIVPNIPLHLINPQHRHRRSVHDTPYKLDLEALDQSFKLSLWPNDGLLSPNAVFLIRDDKDTRIVDTPWQGDGCFYQGKVDGASADDVPRGVAALSMCGGMRGVISSDGVDYVIQPVKTTTVQKRSVDARIAAIPHVIYRRRPYEGQVDDIDLPSLAPQGLRVHGKILEFEPTRKRRHANRDPRRLNNQHLYIETAVFVDSHLYADMKKKFQRDVDVEVAHFVLAMINAVQLLYNDPSLGFKVDFVLKRLEILAQDPKDLFPSLDIDVSLTNFCLWQNKDKPVSDRHPLNWDHAIMLTGLDLYAVDANGKTSSQVVGLAPVAGMCTRDSSCTVNEGKHFEGVYVITHEIGHNLGMRHDGPQANNDCDPSKYIMSPTLGTGKITWSECSRSYLQKFLSSPHARCLFDRDVAQRKNLDHTMFGLPGERFDADQQCMLKYGRGSYHSNDRDLRNICQDLHCRKDNTVWNSHPALEGTHCGPGMWCRRGQCRNIYHDDEDDERINRRPVDGGWSSWSAYSSCSSSCLHGRDGLLFSGSTGIMVSTRSCNNPHPSNGGRPCSGKTKRYETCNAARQCTAGRKKKIIDYADEICTQAAKYDTTLEGTGLQRVSMDGQRACTVWCYKRSGGYVTHGRTFPDGTVCDDGGIPGRSLYCVNGECQEFRCDNNDGFTNDPSSCQNGEYRRLEEPWGPWRSVSECRFNCLVPAKGVRLVRRECQLYHGCQGLATSLQLCYPYKPKCVHEETPFEYATAVCSRFRNDKLSGIGMQLSATRDDTDRSCRIACQDKEVHYRFYKVLGEEGWFPFGTDCSRGDYRRKAYCLNGKCVDFGEDDTPLQSVDYTLNRIQKRELTINNTHISGVGTLDEKLLLEIIRKLNLTGSTFEEIQQRTVTEKIDFNNPMYVYAKMEDEDDKQRVTERNPWNMAGWMAPTKITDVATPIDGNFEGVEGALYSWQTVVSNCSIPCGIGVQTVFVRCVSGSTHLPDRYCDEMKRPGYSQIQSCHLAFCDTSAASSRSRPGSSWVKGGLLSVTVMLIWWLQTS